MDAKRKLLLVDDESSITDTFGPALERQGFIVAIARDGGEALRKVADFHPDLIVLDIGLPKLAGGEVLRELREKGNETPVIVLSRFGDSEEIALTLQRGADDYMNKPRPLVERGVTEIFVKPFGLAELVERIRKVLRRTSAPGYAQALESQRLISGELVLDHKTWHAYLRSRDLDLTPKALVLLEYLMRNAGQVFSRDDLLNTVWGWDYVGGTRTVDTHIRQLRKALNDDPDPPTYIETVRSMGYRFIGVEEVKP